MKTRTQSRTQSRGQGQGRGGAEREEEEERGRKDVASHARRATVVINLAFNEIWWCSKAVVATAALWSWTMGQQPTDEADGDAETTGSTLAAADEWRRHMAWAGVGVELVLLLISHQASYDSVVSWVSWVS